MLILHMSTEVDVSFGVQPTRWPPEVANGTATPVSSGRWRASCWTPSHMKSATEHEDASGAKTITEDAELLIRLSGIHSALLRSERSETAIRIQLREQQIEVSQLEAVFGSDERALTSLKNGTAADRVAVEVLETALAGAENALHAARVRLAQLKETTAPLLRHLEDTLGKLRKDAGTAKEDLSSSTRRFYEGLVRLKKLPLVAYFQAGLCGECHLKLPSALAGTVLTGSTLLRCPLCGRVLLPPEPLPSSLR
jgi:predicted  nucleic acid-binding Zn-ribbon protein